MFYFYKKVILRDFKTFKNLKNNISDLKLSNILYIDMNYN